MAKIIRIAATRNGHRRAGMAHSRKATDHSESAFTKAQLEALQADPRLLVQIIDAPESAKKGGKAAAAKTATKADAKKDDGGDGKEPAGNGEKGEVANAE